MNYGTSVVPCVCNLMEETFSASAFEFETRRMGTGIMLQIETNTFLIMVESHTLLRSRDRAVGIATDYGLDDQEVGVRVPEGLRMFSSPCSPDRLWGPPSPL
jgi:hypothetical protein